MSLINREALIAEYDRVHIGTPGGARKLMLDAPEVKPEPKWIPCSERLPEEGRRVIVYDNERACIYIASYEADRYYSGSYWEDDEGLICDFEEISAWMPLPEPYREEGEK